MSILHTTNTWKSIKTRHKSFKLWVFFFSFFSPLLDPSSFMNLISSSVNKSVGSLKIFFDTENVQLNFGLLVYKVHKAGGCTLLVLVIQAERKSYFLPETSFKAYLFIMLCLGILAFLIHNWFDKDRVQVIIRFSSIDFWLVNSQPNLVTFWPNFEPFQY